MIDFSQDYFALFGLPRGYRFDAARLDAAYRRLQSEVHPDRFAAAPDAQRRIALQSSARVNEAYRALKNPIERAEYLLSLHGVDTHVETDTALSIDFLEAQLERREAVGEAKTHRDAHRLDDLLAQARDDIARLERSLAEQLDAAEWIAARSVVRQLRFLQKMVADIESGLQEIED